MVINNIVNNGAFVITSHRQTTIYDYKPTRRAFCLTRYYLLRPAAVGGYTASKLATTAYSRGRSATVAT